MEIINGKVKPALLSSSSVFTLVFREQANNGPRLLNTAHAEPWTDTIKTWHTYSMQGSACMRHPNHLMLASASCWLMVHVTTPTSTIVLHKPASHSIQRQVWKGELSPRSRRPLHWYPTWATLIRWRRQPLFLEVLILSLNTYGLILQVFGLIF